MLFPQQPHPFFAKLRAIRHRLKRRRIRVARTLTLENNVTDAAHAAGELLATLHIAANPDALQAMNANAVKAAIITFGMMRLTNVTKKEK